jgi:hypothetical protein
LKAILAVGIDVRVTRWRQTRHIGLMQQIVPVIEDPPGFEGAPDELADMPTGSAASLIQATSIFKRSTLNSVDWEI